MLKYVLYKLDQKKHLNGVYIGKCPINKVFFSLFRNWFSSVCCSLVSNLCGGVVFWSYVLLYLCLKKCKSVTNLCRSFSLWKLNFNICILRLWNNPEKKDLPPFFYLVFVWYIICSCWTWFKCFAYNYRLDRLDKPIRKQVAFLIWKKKSLKQLYYREISITVETDNSKNYRSIFLKLNNTELFQMQKNLLALHLWYMF